MKAQLTVLLLVLFLMGSLSTNPPPEPASLRPGKSVMCYECSQSGTYNCDNLKQCNSTSGYCHLITFEGQDGETSVRESCAADCGFPTTIFVGTKNYFALCCSFNYCNSLQYSREVEQNHANIPISGFSTSLFWAHFRIILQYIGLEY